MLRRDLVVGDIFEYVPSRACRYVVVTDRNAYPEPLVHQGRKLKLSDDCSAGWTGKVEVLAGPTYDKLNAKTDAPVAEPRAMGEVSEISAPTSSVDPDHYKSLDPEPIDVIDAWDLGFALGNVVKYIARAGRKPNVACVEDLKKARRYLSRAIAAAEGRRAWD